MPHIHLYKYLFVVLLNVILLPQLNAMDSTKNSHVHVLNLFSAIARHGDLAIVQSLVPDYVDVNCKDPDGLWNSPLVCATFYKRHDIMSYLLEKGGDIQICGKHDVSLLHIATTLNDHKAAFLLKAYGANHEIEDKRGITPLGIALEKNYTKLIDLFLPPEQEQAEKPVKSNAPLTLNDQLFDAISNGDTKTIDRLMEQGAKIENYLNAFPTALHCVIKSKHPHLVDYFIKKGCDINYADKNGFTLLHHAAYKDNLEMIKELVFNGITIDAQDTSGHSPLFIAMRVRALKAIPYLILLGAKAELPHQPLSLFDIAHQEDKKAGNNDMMKLLTMVYKEKPEFEKTHIIHFKPVVKPSIQSSQEVFSNKLNSFFPEVREFKRCPLAFLSEK